MNHAMQNNKLNTTAVDKSKGRGKPTLRRKLIVTALALAFAPMSFAAPTGGQVTSGTGSVNQVGATTTITQSSQNLSLNWSSFNIGTSETVNFLQPSASAIAVNRILDTNGTQILGHLNANGQVYLINPNGILFGQGSQVNVGGLVASTLNIDDASLGSSTKTFGGNGSGSIINQGTINAASGGYVALLGNTVSNQGAITAPLGTVALGAGSATTLTFAGNSLVKMQIDQSTLNNLAANGGLIQAEGGMVLMSAGARDSLLASVVNNTGIIEARTVQNHNGTIILLGGMVAGTVNVGGALDASAPANPQLNGGFIETSAAHVKVADSAYITTAAANGLSGTWLIDPVDFTIAATGGDMTGAAVSAALAGGNISILSTAGTVNTTTGLGDVNVNDAVSWSANKLTLNAQNNININAAMNATVTASLALEFGQGAVALNNTSNIVTGVNGVVNLPAGTTNFTTLQGSNGVLKNYTVITALGAAGSVTATDLQGINGNLAGNYVLGANIDAAATSTWSLGAGFTPIGSPATNFSGTFDGLGHTISNLTVADPWGSNGMFGFTATGSTISNLGLLNVNVTSSAISGGLVSVNRGTISNVGMVGGSVSGNRRVGGLVGLNYGTINNSYATGSVSGSTYVGGLVGYNAGTISKISNSYATGSVSGIEFVGGLVGYTNYGTVSNSYATGSVSGGSYAGGLVGAGNGTITNSFYDLDVVTINTLKPVAANGLYTSQFTDWKNSGFALNPVTYFGAATAVNTYTVTGVQGLKDLLGFTGDAALTFNLAGNIDMAAAPAGFYLPSWAGTFDGANYTLSNFTLNLPTTSKVGLFGKALAGSSIKNIGMIGGSATGSSYVGGLVGLNYGTISNSYATGSVTSSVTGSSYVGGLVGSNYGTISNSYATGSVSGSNYVGGLVGAGGGTISNSYATGSVSGSNYVGGLVGVAWSPTISNSYATGSVTGSNYVGGLMGYVNGGTISNSYATGSVTGSSKVGGLAGYGNGGTISNSYATGSVSGGSYVGGLAGYCFSGTISNSYATGLVTGTTNVGGLLGFAQFTTLTANFWDVTQSGMADGLGIGLDGTTAGVAGTPQAGVSGLTTAQMQTQSSFVPAGTAAGQWDFANTWVMYEGYTAPLLRSFLTALTVTANNASKTYDGLAYNGSAGVTYSVTPNANLLGTLSYTGGTNAGSYAIAPSGLYSNQQGYLISFVDGALTVDKAAATVTANSGSGTYSGVAQNVSGFTATGLVNNEAATVLTGVTASGTGTNAGSYASTASGTDGNYNLTFVDGALVIGKANATVTANSGSGTYTGLAQSVSGFTATNLVNNETASVLTGVSATGTGTNAGSYSVGVSGTDSNYNLTLVNGTLTVNPAALTATLTGTPSKVYDGTTAATLSSANYSLGGFVPGEGATVGQTSGTYNSQNVLAATTVSATLAAGDFTPSGSTLLSNYTLPTGATGAGSITPAGLSAAADAATRMDNRLVFSGTPGGVANAGSYVLVPSGVYASLYSISYSSNTLTVLTSPTQVSLAGGVYESWSGLLGSYAPYLVVGM